MKNIYVGNLDAATNEDQIRDLFQAYGAVATVTLATDRDTGSPRGFAFVEMASDAEAAAAIKALHGNVVADRQLIVNEARPKLAGDRNQQVERRQHARDPLDVRKHRQHRY